MNKVVKAVILSVAALATVASTVEIASAGDRYWRKHHAKPWKKRVVITGVTAGVVAGAVVASRPRIVYRDAPVIVDEEPVYDSEAIYDDGAIYADPDDDYAAGVYRDDMPENDDYAAPAYDGNEDPLYDEERSAATDDDYFPDRPEPRIERKRSDVARNADVESKPRKRDSTVTRKEADAGALRPWSREWKEWCASRFQSFNPQNGTYLGYDQKRHFCKAG